MAKLSKRIVDQAEADEVDYFVWDDELPGFGLRVFATGKRSYIVSVYYVKEKGAPQNVPIGVLMSATRDSIERAARSIKRRALGQPGKG